MRAGTRSGEPCPPNIRWATRILTIALSVAVCSSFGTGPGFAQPAPASGILADGNAVVTGFSGMRLPTLIRPGADPSERATIDLDGPVLRVIDLQAPGAAPQAQVLTAAKPFTVTASQMGQVFAVALDNASPPNIYVAATSVYGLPIVVPDADGDGQPDRQEEGAANASFMAGLFGPRQAGGGPGSIWRIDGTTGQVRLFANVTLDGAPNSGPALGGLAFDATSNALFVADRETGMVHRFDLNGSERGRYNHGTQGRTATGLAPVPFDPGRRVSITRPPFQPANPGSWGYAPLQRRIFGLAVREGRLYYSVAENLQVWSVAITPDGFGTDARVEITVPPGHSASEISKIAFDDQGRMLLAERLAPTGAFNFTALTEEGVGRVLRYVQAPSATGPAWQPTPDEYAIGFAAQPRGNGGVAVGYGYDAGGRLDRNACSGFAWSTGEQLRVSPDSGQAAQLAQGGPTIVNGVQGNGIDLLRAAGAPPLQSYFVDFDNRFDDANARGQMGDVTVFRACARIATAQLQQPPGEQPPPGAQPPPGEGAPMPPDGGFAGPDGDFGPGPGPDGLIFIEPVFDGPPPPPPVCPVGTHLEDKGVQCCPPNMIPGVSGACISPCANGSMVAADMFACYRGFQPGNAPGGATVGVCWNGQPAVKVNPALPNSYANNKCPKPPLKRCPAGTREVAVGPPPQAAARWSNVRCDPIGAAFCPAGQQPNMDGVCQNLCPGGQTAFPVRRCCVNGTNVNALGQCPGVIVPPQWYLNYLATGTGPCLLPSGNCSYYEFTITGRQRFGRGSITQRITLPPGSDLQARITRGSRYCPASAWSCSRSGNVLTCSADDCGLASDDQVVLRIEGRVVPELTEPPPVTIEKTACGVLEWQAMPGPGRTVLEQLRETGRVQPLPQPPVSGAATDQYGRTTGQQACWTIQVVGKPPARPVTPCPPNYVSTPDGQCCIAGQMTTRGVCCPAGQRPDPRGRTCVPAEPRIPAFVPPPPDRCPPEAVRLRSGECCPRSQMTTRGVCCPAGQRPDLRRRTCVPVTPERPVVMPILPQCTGGKMLVGNRCVCPSGATERRGRCVPIRVTPIPPQCRGGKVPIDNRCVCPSGTREVRGFCKPVQAVPERPAVPRCTGGKVPAGNRCVCPSGTNQVRGQCVRIRPIPQTEQFRPRPRPTPQTEQFRPRPRPTTRTPY